MNVSVWDTYVSRKDDALMHFDILVPENTEQEKVIEAARKYLATKPFVNGLPAMKQCRHCHIERATDEVVKAINERGYFILEMQNCY